MALTINPAGSGTRIRWVVDSGVFYLGALVGALGSLLLVAASFALLSLVLPGGWLVPAAVVLAVPPLLYQMGLPVPLPYRRRQVPEWWRNVLPLRVAAFAYGVMLGFGFATPFTSSAHSAMLLALPFLHGIGPVLAVVALFAAGKTTVLVLGQGTVSHDDVIVRLPDELGNARRRWSLRVAGAGATLLVLVALLASR
jgi:hypothetical protein